LDQHSKGWMAAVLNQREQFVVFFLGQATGITAM